MTGDPNAYKLTSPAVQGVPSLGDGQEWVIDDEGFGVAEVNQLERRCGFWQKVSHKVPI